MYTVMLLVKATFCKVVTCGKVSGQMEILIQMELVMKTQ